MRISDWSSDVCSSDLVAMNADIAETDRRAVARCLVNTGPQAIAFFMEVARHIERDRFDEDDDALLLARQPHAFAEHLRRIAPVRRHREDDTGNIAEDCKAVVVVEMSAEALLITQTRDADDHRVGILPVKTGRASCRGRGWQSR